jgi:vacuolar iron transporter family protein
LRRLSNLEHAQAEYWANRLPAEQRWATSGLRFGDRIPLWLVHWFGARAVLAIVAGDALRGVERYRAQSDATAVLPTELEVASETAALASAPSSPADLARDHRRSGAAGGSLRAAVFGVNDGLVSNLSLVMGVAGAAGEHAMLVRRYQDKGIPAQQAEAIADQLMADPSLALDTIAREQLGHDPNELGSPQAAAVASFISFGVGALLPLAPFGLAEGWAAVLASAAVSAVTFVVGHLIGVGAVG